MLHPLDGGIAFNAMQHSSNSTHPTAPKVPWNKGKMTGAKPPLQTNLVWSVRTKLQMDGRKRDLAMFNLAIDSRLRDAMSSSLAGPAPMHVLIADAAALS